MNARFIHRKRPIVLVADATTRSLATQQAGHPGLPLSWQVDETLVALTRAAMTRGIPVAVPMDLHYAPLVAQVASEYVSPEVAEGESPWTFGRDGGLPAVSFFSLGKSTTQGNDRAALPWTEVFRDLKIVSERVQPYQRFFEIARPFAIVGVGQGPKINAAFKVTSNLNVPRWRMAAPAVKASRGRAAVESYAERIERKLAELRTKHEFMAVGGGSRVNEVGERDVASLAPPYFRAYAPLTLHAQLLVEELAGREN